MSLLSLLRFQLGFSHSVWSVWEGHRAWALGAHGRTDWWNLPEARELPKIRPWGPHHGLSSRPCPGHHPSPRGLPSCHQHLAMGHRPCVICCFLGRLSIFGDRSAELPDPSCRQAPGTGFTSALWLASLEPLLGSLPTWAFVSLGPKALVPVSQAVRAVALARACPGSTSPLQLPLKSGLLRGKEFGGGRADRES